MFSMCLDLLPKILPLQLWSREPWIKSSNRLHNFDAGNFLGICHVHIHVVSLNGKAQPEISALNLYKVKFKKFNSSSYNGWLIVSRSSARSFRNLCNGPRLAARGTLFPAKYEVCYNSKIESIHLLQMTIIPG